MSDRASPDTSTESNFDEPEVKVILLGDSAVGKSKLVERFLQDDFNPRRLSTYALTLYRKNVPLGDGKSVKVDFWDTAGQERFRTMHPSYYHKAHACILVFDVTRKQTYLNLKTWYTELRQKCPEIPAVVIANKIDVDYLVTKKSFKFPKSNNLPFFFVSSADGTNVVKVFEEAVRAGVAYRKHGGGDFVDECLELFTEEPIVGGGEENG